MEAAELLLEGGIPLPLAKPGVVLHGGVKGVGLEEEIQIILAL